MKHSINKVVAICLIPEVVVTAVKIALIVGTVLALINHGGAIVDGSLTLDGMMRIAVSYCVPYSVSTYSSVKIILSGGREITHE